MNLSQSEFNDFLSVLREWIQSQFKFWRTYTAKVVIVNDPDHEGKVALSCAELMAVDNDSYIWAIPVGNPRQFVNPRVGDLGSLFFRDSDPEVPRFIADPPHAMVKDQAEQGEFVLVETPKNSSHITVNEEGGFTLESKSPAGVKSEVTESVLGMRLKELLDKILDDYVTDLYTRVNDLAGITDDLNKHVAILKPGPFVAWGVKLNKFKSDLATQKGKIPGTKADYATPGRLLSHTNKNN